MWTLARAVSSFADDEFNLPVNNNSNPVIKQPPPPILRQGKFWPKAYESDGLIEILKTDDEVN